MLNAFQQIVFGPSDLEIKTEFDGSLKGFLGLGDPPLSAVNLHKEEPGAGLSGGFGDQGIKSGLDFLEPTGGDVLLGEMETDLVSDGGAPAPGGFAEDGQDQQNRQNSSVLSTSPPGGIISHGSGTIPGLDHRLGLHA
jgi:hypothetical protein